MRGIDREIAPTGRRWVHENLPGGTQRGGTALIIRSTYTPCDFPPLCPTQLLMYAIRADAPTPATFDRLAFVIVKQKLLLYVNSASTLELMDVVPSDADEAVDALMTMSKVLVGITASSLISTLDTVTLPQFRILVLLAGQERTRPSDLARQLSVQPSGITRMLDRLVAAGFVLRSLSDRNSREMDLALTVTGEALVADVLAQREDDLRHLVSDLTASEMSLVVSGLKLLTARGSGLHHTAALLGW